MNKLVKKVIFALEAEMRQENKEPNWTALLGHSMAAINSQEQKGANQVAAYKAVLGFPYKLHANVDSLTLRQC